ncbi:MAG: hypothetical protein AB9846_16845 [Tenuifilaceae bacterium]
MNRIIIGILGVCMLSCSLSNENPSSFNIKAKINDEVKLSNEFTITVKNVYDSRCPEGCECIWAGEVEVLFRINSIGNSLDTSLVLPSRPEMYFDRYKIELKSVNPYPVCNTELPDNFTIYFKVDDLNK